MSVMRRFLWFVFLFHGFAVAQVPPDSYFKRKEEQVREMAAEIVRLDEARCDLSANCSSSCSRHACTPIDGFHDRTKYNFTCQRQELPNGYCPSSGGGDCKSRQVNYGMSYIRMPSNVELSAIPDGIPDEMCSTICMTRNFTTTLRALADQNVYANHVNELFYFGSIDGICRSYPGEELSVDDSCIEFDPRRRAWYNGAISVETYLVVMIDNSNGAANFQTNSPLLSYAIDASKVIIKALIDSSSSGDTLDVIAFDATNATVMTNPVPIGDDNGTIAGGNGSEVLEKSKTTLHGVIDKITPSDSATAGCLGFVQAITNACQRINNSDDKATPVILVFTSGGFATEFQQEHRQPVSQMLSFHSTKLFIYSFGNSSNLQALAKESGGYFKILRNGFDNPLYQISSFFNFMALARNATTNEPYWTKFFKDYDARGNIISVSYQALSPKRHLVGVAGIDISFKSVQGGIPRAIEDKSGFRPTKSRNLTIAHFEVQSTDNICGSCKQAVCPRSSSKSFTELECCDTCHSETHKWRAGMIVAATVVPGVVVPALIIAATWWWRKRRERSKSLEVIMTNISSTDVGPYR